MGKQRCSLCGGKIVDNKCIECGLDNTQNDEQYKNRINRSACDGEPMTHIHKEETPKKPQKQKKPKNRMRGFSFRVLYVIFIIIIVIFIAWSRIKELGYERILGSLNIGGTYEDELYADAEEERDPYAHVKRELAKDGEAFKTVLQPGFYIVGLHIPEGAYVAKPAEGYEGYIQLWDAENEIYYFVEFGDYEGAVWEQDDIRMYDGASLEVPTGMAVQLYSDNAQAAQMKMHGMDNPLVEEVLIHENATSGVDFEPGVYDILYVPQGNENEQEYGTVTYTPSIEDMKNGTPSNSVYFYGYQGEEMYRNVSMPKGTTVVLEGLSEVKLIPSPKIAAESYRQYYPQY